MFTNILVYENALADEHPALQRAIQLASDAKAELKIIDVVQDESNHPDDRRRKMRSLVEQERDDRLDLICQPLRELDIPFTVELLRGRPFAEIVREVVHENFDLVIKATSLATPNEVTGVMGPVDMRIVRNCPCPVWLEARHPPGTSGALRCKDVLVAIDPQAVLDDLNRSLLKTAMDLAKASDAVLHVIAAWEVLDEDLLKQKTSLEKLTKYTTHLRSSARKNLDRLLTPVGNAVHPENIHLRKGNASEVILQWASNEHPDVVVMGTVGDAPTRGLLIGDTADNVLRRIRCPILAIKPQGLFHVA